MFTMIQITDLHMDNDDPELKHLKPEDNFKAFLKAASRIQCDRIIITGDVAEEEDNFKKVIGQLQELSTEIKYVAGNHDPMYAYKPFNLKGPYFMEYLEELLILYLDTGKGIIDEEQLQWLMELIAVNEKDILIFMHHPILDCGNTIMDRMYPLKNRNDVINILNKTNKKTYIFCGHYHWEQKMHVGNITQYITPSLLYQLDQHADILRIGSIDFGYRVIRISKDDVETYVEVLTQTD